MNHSFYQTLSSSLAPAEEKKMLDSTILYIVELFLFFSKPQVFLVR